MKPEVNVIRERLDSYRSKGKSLFATSSFQTQSIPLLHIISQVDNTIPVYFLNTGYLFPETLTFKDTVAADFGLNVIGLRSAVPKTQQRDSSGNLFFVSDPDYCCHLNKVQPLEPILQKNDVWINGIRADQSKTREGISEEQEAPFGCVRYHPMLTWTGKMVAGYIAEHGLPRHPLEDNGYFSIGCEPCTRKYLEPADARSGRWFGMTKSECGLHTELIVKEKPVS